MQLAARPRITAGAKEVATQRWITAGTAGVAVAGLIAVAPGVNPVLPHLQHELQASAVRLTAGWDPLTDLQTAFNTALTTAQTNASTLANNFMLAPGVGLQQAIVNQVGFLREVLNDPSSIGTVLTQIATNASVVATGLTGIGATAATNKAAQAHSVDALHGALLSLLPTMLPPSIPPAVATSVLNVLASPLSGLVMGAVGPVISPAVALFNSVLAVGAAIQASDPAAALSALLSAPVKAVGAFFNGADLNLDALVPLIAQAGILPASTAITSLDVAFGGLLSVGSVSQGTYTQNGTITPITTPGGSILNSIGLGVSLNGIALPILSQPVGPLGALESISQTVGVLLGDHWDGKKAVQVAPLSTLTDTAATPAALAVKAPATASVAALPSAAATAALATAPATKAIEAAAPKDATDTTAAAKDSTATGTSATDATTKSSTSSTSSTDATDSSTSSAASSTGDTTTKGDTGTKTGTDTGTKGGSDTGTKGDHGTKGGRHAKGDGGAKKSGDHGSKSGSNSKGSGDGGRHRK
jgi:hypothetical protein